VSRLVADTIDLPKVLCLPEPRRTAQWLRMSYVACNGNWDEFEAVYEYYCIWMEPRRIPKQSRNVLLRRQTYEGQRQPDGQSQEQRPDRNDTRDQQTSAECQEEMKVKQRPTRHITGPPLTRSGFLWALSKTMHGVRIYSPEGRVQSCSATHASQKFNFIVLGFCARKIPLTFASTNREGNRRQLQ
jgi:hypothetical protein